ncbi:hypothetical protein BpHYR1_019698 [Brachionus plicatilis]|uniref:Uncharacterized protein n=1 Tax=Brachionus plicatilis TaxID=10195 RepID=A0A3M7P3R0_BRAPC|nr:hypothetical protein BpHYR1_019698 [Brachionus plicatilis]
MYLVVHGEQDLWMFNVIDLLGFGDLHHAHAKPQNTFMFKSFILKIHQNLKIKKKEKEEKKSIN